VKKKLTILIFIAACIFIVISCKKEVEPPDFTTKITITTKSADSIGYSNAYISGTLGESYGKTVQDYGHCWDTVQMPDTTGNKTSFGSSTGNKTFTSTLQNLVQGKQYYIRTYFIIDDIAIYSNQINFYTLLTCLPVVQTDSITNITASSALFAAKVVNDGGEPVTSRGFCWSALTNPTLSDDFTESGSGLGSFTIELANLDTSTTYYVRAYAINNNGTQYGNELSFKTRNGIPTLVTADLIKVSSGTYTCGATLVDDGGATLEGFGLVWSNTNQYPTTESNDGIYNYTSNQTTFTTDITGLYNYLIFYIRAYVVNPYGIFYGNSILLPIRTDWQISLGGSASDETHSIQKTTDGGYIIVGHSHSNDEDVTVNHGQSDYWIVKLTSAGELDWQKSLGGSDYERAYSIQQTIDGGYIVAGYSASNDGDVTVNYGQNDYWIVKLTSAGELDWQKALGGSYGDQANSIQQTTDGGYIIAGYSSSDDGDVSENHGQDDYWIVKLTSAGDIDWQKSFGGSSIDRAYCINQTTEGGYIIAGTTFSNNGDVSMNHGYIDYWIVKLTSAGDIVWQKSLGGSDYDYAYSIQQTIDEGYIVAGYTKSNDGDVTGNHGYGDYWIVKLTSAGDIDWQKSFGGSDFDLANSIQQTTDGGYIIAGYSDSDDGDVSENLGGNDYWLVKTTSTGELDWQISLGGSDHDRTFCIHQTTDGRYIIAGYSDSKDGDVSGNHGNRDFWIVKF